MQTLRHNVSSPRHPDAVGRQGFTMAELLAVLLIMMLLMGIAVSSFYGLGRGSRMRGAVSTFNAVLSLTRQYAITRTVALDVVLVNTTEDVFGYYVRRADTQVTFRPVQYLPPGMKFARLSQPQQGGTPIVETDFTGDGYAITFMPDGGLKDVYGTLEIDLRDEVSNLPTASIPAVTFYLNGLTGLIRVSGD